MQFVVLVINKLAYSVDVSNSSKHDEKRNNLHALAALASNSFNAS